MPLSVHLTEDALGDLDALHRFISNQDSPQKANHVLEQIEKVVLSLSELPKRGAVPKELEYLGRQDYREVFFTPYRVIYRVIGESVYIYLIADGRRDMQGLMQRRLLDG